MPGANPGGLRGAAGANPPKGEDTAELHQGRGNEFGDFEVGPEDSDQEGAGKTVALSAKTDGGVPHRATEGIQPNDFGEKEEVPSTSQFPQLLLQSLQ